MQSERPDSNIKHLVSHRDEAGDPDFLIEKDPEGRFRLWFHNRLEPLITAGDWVGITISPRCFLYMVDNLQNVLQEMTDQE